MQKELGALDKSQDLCGWNVVRELKMGQRRESDRQLAAQYSLSGPGTPAGFYFKGWKEFQEGE